MSGKLEKMLILAFNNAKDAEKGYTAAQKLGNRDKITPNCFKALINPESYTVEQKLKFTEKQGSGTSGKELKYEYSEPEEMTFEFLFDNTGIIDENPRESIADDLKKFRELVIDYKGDTHEPRYFILAWGTFLFRGRATEVSITYKLFAPDGTPIRAIAKVKFKASIEELKRAAKENKQSPDLTHERIVKAGDTLPLMCQRIYGEAKRYLQVAEYNSLSNFRNLVPGQRLLFPPIEKTPQ